MACKYILDGIEYDEQVFKNLINDKFVSRAKTRRILEVQSDLFQKGRDRNELVKRTADYNLLTEEEEAERDELIRKHNQPESDEDVATFSQERLNELNNKLTSNKEEVNGSKNNFLQLLNKDGNWIPFFIKTIVQDSAKKGYEKVLFPTGDTASKVEGHQTLEDFKKQKEDRIKVLEQDNDNYVKEDKLVDGSSRWAVYSPTDRKSKWFDSKKEADDWNNLEKQVHETEIKQLQEELKRVESEGFAALKPIYNFYENRVYRELEKMYGREGVTRIKDNYGNEWYEVDVVPEIDKSAIFFQLSTPEALNRIYKGFQKSLEPVYRNNLFIGLRANKGDNRTLAKKISDWISDKEPFSNIEVFTSPTYNTINFRDKNTGRMYQLTGTEHETDKGVYRKYTGSTIGELSSQIPSDKRFLYTDTSKGKGMDTSQFSKVLTSSEVREKEAIDRYLVGKWDIEGRGDGLLEYFGSGNTNDSDISGKSLNELWRKRGKDPRGFSVGLTAYIYKRIGEPGGFFDTVRRDIAKRTGKDLFMVKAHALLDRPGVAIEADENGIILYPHYLNYIVAAYNKLEDALKIIDQYLLEEFIHVVSFNLLNSNDIDTIYNKLSSEEKLSISKIYGPTTKSEMVNEYIRMIVQEQLTGQVTESTYPKSFIHEAVEIVKRALQTIVSIFNKKPDNDYIKERINKIVKVFDIPQIKNDPITRIDINRIDKKVSQQIEQFIKNIGGTIQYKKDIIIDGKVIPANAVADVISRTILIADGKEQDDTLPEEAAHIYMHWLPDSSSIKQSMVRDIKRTLDYRKTLDEYGSNPLYQNSDGTVNTNKIAIEAIGKRIASVIVGKKDKIAESWWQKLLTWIKNLFRGKSFDSYEQAAEDILSADTSRLDLAAIKEADAQGRYYLQLSAEDNRFYNTLDLMASPAQKAVINDLIRNPQVTLGEGHKYTSLIQRDTTLYHSLTESIGVQGPPNSEDYENNRQWGNDFDRILKGIVERRELSDIEATPFISDSIRQKIYTKMSEYINGKVSQGWLPLTQVTVSDRVSGIAGTIDLLLVSPSGTLQVVDLKTSWNSAQASPYRNTQYSLKEDSVLRKEGKVSLSKKQQHAIQTGGYTKLLQIMGYQKISDPVTKHFRVAATDGIVTDFVDEGEVLHKATEMQSSVDTIIPTPISAINRLEQLGVESIVQSKEQIDEKELEKEQTTVPGFTATDQEEFRKEVSNIVDILGKYREELTIASKMKRTARNTAVQAINEVMENIHIAAASGQFDVAYKEFLLYAKGQTDNLIKQLKDPKNFADTRYIQWLTLAQSFITAMQGSLYITSTIEKDPEMVSLGLALNDNIVESQSVINNASKRVVSENIIRPTNNNPLMTARAITDGLDRMEDITDLNSKISDIANSGNFILEALDKKIKTTFQKEHTRSESVKEQMIKAGDELISAASTKDPKVLYDRLFQKYSYGPKKGQKTGKMLGPIGSVYDDIKNRVVGATRNTDGSPKVPIEHPVTDADYEYNIQLWKDRTALFEFSRGEILTWDRKSGETIEELGQYHYLSDEYAYARDKVLTKVNGHWVPIAGKEKDLKEFRNKYQTFNTESWKMTFDNNGQPTGIYEKDTTGMWYPNREHLVVREISSDGVDLRDPEYKKLMTATDKVGQAQYKYLLAYRDIISTEIEEHLTPQQQVWFQEHYIPAVGTNFLQQLGREGSNKMDIILNELKGWFTIKGYTSQTDIQRMQGSLTDSLPLIYTANLQSQERLDVIVSLIAEHDKNKESLTTVREKKLWAEETKRLESLRIQEMNKITPEQIHPDLTQGALAFLDMSSRFSVNEDLKDELSAVRNVLTAAKYYRYERNALGDIIGKKELAATESNTVERLRIYEDMVWKYDETIGKDLAHTIARKAMKLTSGIGMAFNWLGHIHNVIQAQVNNHIDSFGNELYDRRAIRRMIKESSAAQLSFIQQQGSWGLEKRSTYKKRPACHKFESLSREFNMVEHIAVNDPGRVNLFGDVGYATMEAGEFIVQSKTGNAILDSIMLHNSKGDQLSVYDAYNFDNKTGKSTIEDGWMMPDGTPFDDNARAKIHNRIRETNKRIHGNYRDIDRTAMERHWYGMMIMQYHKWIYPAFRSRFQRKKWDNNLGADGMWNEGRYRSAAAFVRALYDKTVSIDALWKDAFKDMSKMSKEDKMQWIKDNWEGLIRAEDYKEFDDKIQNIDDRIQEHQKLRQYQNTPQLVAQWQQVMTDLRKEKEDMEKIIDDMLVRLMEHRKNNLKKITADLLYICVLFVAYHYLGALSKGLGDDDPYLKRLVNWATWEADRNTKEVALFVPVVGIVESYQLIKSPVAALGSVRDFGQLVNAMIQYPIQNEEQRYLQRGPHEGELKMWKETTDLLPIARQYNRVVSFDNINSFFIK